MSEQALGNIIRHSGLKRESLVIATKIYPPMNDDPNNRGLSPKHALDGIDASLHRLQMECVDLYQIHRWDTSTPIEETKEAVHDIIRAGKAR